ncbi:MAG: 30S ribosomal protein S2 [Demequinaceae bacterium]|nr:30S ribosomal protein S2 [Demequinaceae bacterium]
MAVVTMRQMLDSGVHFGHQTSRWNPKMKRFIFAERNGIYIIDLQQSLKKIDEAYAFVRDTVAHGGTVLFVGTKRQAQEPIVEQASRVGMPYVSERWLGGMLTNFSTVSKRVTHLKELEEIDYEDVAGSGHTKKELLGLRRKKEKLEKVLGGIRAMNRTPSVLWVVDTNKEHLAVEEANKLGIPVVGILDSNCDPDKITYGIPGNDDAIRSVHLLTRVIADAVAEGLVARHAARAEAGEAPIEEEPLAEWERELLGGEDEAPKAEEPVDEDKPTTEKVEADEKSAAKKPAAEKKAPAEKKPAAKKPAAEKKPAAKKPAAKKLAAEKATKE